MTLCCRRQHIALDGEFLSLLGLLTGIGAASLAFHTFANRLSSAADVLAIALYLQGWLALYLRRAWSWPRQTAWLGIPAFFRLSQLFSAAWQWANITNAGYLGAWTVLLLVVANSALRRSNAVWPLASAAAVFLISVALRQIDLSRCAKWPSGTHFGWHLLNSVALGLAAWALAIARTISLPGFLNKPSKVAKDHP